MKENILIICYSYSGKTRGIAEMIENRPEESAARSIRGSLTPRIFEQLLSQVRWEIRTGNYPSLLPVTERADKYDIVFAGSPNWCGTIAPPLTAWLKENNMAGKILLPFFSHCGGEDKGMEQAVRDLCPEAKIGSSLYVLENRRENLQDMVQAWLEQNFPENHS